MRAEVAFEAAARAVQVSLEPLPSSRFAFGAIADAVGSMMEPLLTPCGSIGAI